MKWDTVIQEKIGELGKYLTGRSSKLDFSESAPILERTDSRTIREAILRLTQSEAKRREIGKSTLHYLRANAKRHGSFAIRRKISVKPPCPTEWQAITIYFTESH